MIEVLEQLSPVPVYFLETDSMFAGTYQTKAESIAGKAHIKIDNRLTDSQKITTLIHEISHALCDVKDCKCLKNPDHTEREIHANKATLRQLIKYRQKEALEEEMERIEQQAAGMTHYVCYLNAAKHIMKLKLWQKCLDYVGE